MFHTELIRYNVLTGIWLLPICILLSRRSRFLGAKLVTLLFI
jgi:hypothetical protein